MGKFAEGISRLREARCQASCAYPTTLPIDCNVPRLGCCWNWIVVRTIDKNALIHYTESLFMPPVYACLSILSCWSSPQLLTNLPFHLLLDIQVDVLVDLHAI